MRTSGTLYTLGFTFAVCAACSVMVAGSYALLADRQRSDAAIARMRQVLVLGGLVGAEQALGRGDVLARFEAVRALPVDLETGRIAAGIDPAEYDQRAAAQDPGRSRPAPENAAGIRRLPEYAVVYEISGPDGRLERLLLPIHGQGYNGQLYGYIALGPDLDTVRDIVFYEHEETPGLGARVDNPDWRAGWAGRRVYDDSGEVALRVVPDAGPPATDPYRVDALSRATVTSTGIEQMLRFWLGDHAFGPYLAWRRQQAAHARVGDHGSEEDVRP